MIPQTVKKIDSSEFRFLGGVFKVFTKKLAELNITENEPFQIIDEGGSWDGKFAIVGEFWVNDCQTIDIITDKQAEFYFSHLFKASEKKKEYDMLEQQSYFKKLNLELTEQQLFYIKHALELGFKQMPQDDKETYDGILKMFQEK